MHITLRSPIVLSFASRRGHNLAFAVLAALRGTVISAFIFAAYFFPLQHLRGFQVPILWLARILNLPIELLGYALPFLRSPVRFIGLPWSMDYGCAPDLGRLLFTHMRAGVITYVLLFHLPILFRTLRTRRLNRSSPGRPAGHA
jgi:hypothetical protein